MGERTRWAPVHPERGGASSIARYAFNELWSFIAGWAILLDYLIVTALAALLILVGYRTRLAFALFTVRLACALVVDACFLAVVVLMIGAPSSVGLVSALMPRERKAVAVRAVLGDRGAGSSRVRAAWGCAPPPGQIDASGGAAGFSWRNDW